MDPEHLETALWAYRLLSPGARQPIRRPILRMVPSAAIGGLTFTGTFIVPASALTTGTFTTAMSVVGDFQAFQQINLPDGTFQQGPQLGTVHFQGQANVTFTIASTGGNQFMFQDATATFTGTGTETTLTPEPASLLLVGTGLSALALKLKKRRKLIA